MFLRVDNKNVKNCPLTHARVFAQVTHCLVYGHVRTQPGVARIHQPARFVLGIIEKPLHLPSGLVVEERKHILTLFGGRFLDDVRGVIRGQQSHPQAPLANRQSQ